MSELSELIEINRNIERQNEEIIRLLKIIAEEADDKYVSIPYVETPKTQVPETSFVMDDESGIGEVYFIEEYEVFKLSVENNETSINNLTGSNDACHFAEQELIANESIKLNQPVEARTVILNTEQAMDLAKTLEMCYDIHAKNVFMPWFSMTQLVGAPDTLMTLLKLDFYRSDEELIKKVFKTGD